MLRRTGTETCPSDLTFDEWLADGVAQDQQAALESHLATCARCALRLETLVANRERFLRRRPSWHALHAAYAGREFPAGPKRQDHLQAERRSRGLPRRLAGLGALAAAIAVLALLPGWPPDEGTRTKGGPKIAAFVKRGGDVRRLVDGDLVRPGDRLGFAYTVDERMFFALLQRDGTSATVQHPLAHSMVEVAPGREVALDFSIQLDDVGQHEAFFGLFCSTPRMLEPLRAELEQNSAWAPPPGCRCDRLTFIKGGAAP